MEEVLDEVGLDAVVGLDEVADLDEVEVLDVSQAQRLLLVELLWQVDSLDNLWQMENN